MGDNNFVNAIKSNIVSQQQLKSQFEKAWIDSILEDQKSFQNTGVLETRSVSILSFLEKKQKDATK